MRLPIPSHGNLDHHYIKAKWGKTIFPRQPDLFTVGTPEQYRSVLRDAIAQIDALTHTNNHLPSL